MLLDHGRTCHGNIDARPLSYPAQIGMDQYEWKKVIAQTNSARVIKATRSSADGLTTEKVALKQLSWYSQACFNEVETLGRLKHPNIVTLRAFHKGENYVTLVLEWMKKDLDHFIKSSFDEFGDLILGAEIYLETVKRLLYQLLQGLAYLHSRDILHLDLKPANLLVSTDAQLLKIADFGLSQECDDTKFEYPVVTLWYRSPELLLQQNVKSKAIDVWSVGCIFGEMLLGDALFKDSFTESSMLREISRYHRLLESSQFA